MNKSSIITVLKKWRAFPIVLLTTILTIIVLPTSTSAEESLDVLLEGFEDEDNLSSDDALDTVIGGFDDEEGKTEKEISDIKSNNAGTSLNYSFDGYGKLGLTYNTSHKTPEKGRTDWRGFSRIRSELQVDFTKYFSSSWRIFISAKGFYDAVFACRGRHHYTDDVLDKYEDEVEFREAYLLGQLSDHLDIKLGRQIVVWGKSDNIRVTDVLNPLDLREPGLTDIEDLRLPVAMIKLDYYLGDWNLTGMAVPEIRFNKLPAYGHDFFTGQNPLPLEDAPESSLKNTEWAFALSGIFSGWDVAFYFAHIFNDTHHVENVSQNGSIRSRRKHARLNMLGFAYNRALGNWLIKTEMALFDGLKYANAPIETYSRIDGLIGLEYSGFKETTISVEWANRHTNGFDAALALPPDNASKNANQTVFRLTRDFVNDTLTLILIASIYGPSDADGSFERISIEYDWTDMLQTRIGTAIYQSGDRLEMRNIGDNDRIFFELSYHF